MRHLRKLEPDLRLTRHQQFIIHRLGLTLQLLGLVNGDADYVVFTWGLEDWHEQRRLLFRKEHKKK